MLPLLATNEADVRVRSLLRMQANSELYREESDRMEYLQENGYFQAADGVQLFWQSWTVPNPSGILVIAHGLGEHCDRYSGLISNLEGKNIAIYAIDHRGHGRSQGKRGHVTRFKNYTEDLKLLFNRIKTAHPDVPLILLGHSMGGVIAFKYTLTYPHEVDALILSSAGLIPAAAIPALKQKAASILSCLAPELAMSNGLDAKLLSHDYNTVQAYLDDPLVHDRVTSRWYVEFTNAGRECLNQAYKLELPLLIIHGRNDGIVDFHGSEQVMEKASSADKTLYIFDGLYHETMNELPSDRAKVTAIVSQWILVHLNIK